ncbi:MAG: hypothetical protein KGH66_02905 [Candidatus Micrarchaeota archaeon]|nr:hypothetical protein [Candidatus Micrarchaeota archaeon]
MYGGANYTNSWIGINALVILMSLMAVSVVYSISKLLPGETKGKINSFVRQEIVQLFTSVIIVAILVSITFFACSITSTVSQSITQTQLTPFQFANYYVGNLVFNKGFSLMGNIYSTSLSYEILSQVATQAGLYLNYAGVFSSLYPEGPNLKLPTGGVNPETGEPLLSQSLVTISFPPELDIGLLFTNLVDMLLGLFSPMLTLAISSLLIQYITLPFLQYTGFAIILPVAIIMRSFAFTSGELRNASNALLAIAIAGYVVYPLTIAFNAYVVNWVFSASNPSAHYLMLTYTLNNLDPTSFFSQAVPSGVTNSYSPFDTSTLGSFVTLLYNSAANSFPIPINGSIASLQSLINNIAEFLFVGVVLFALDIAMTVGFAIGLSKALNAGVEGAQNFWSGL